MAADTKVWDSGPQVMASEEVNLIKLVPMSYIVTSQYSPQRVFLFLVYLFLGEGVLRTQLNWLGQLVK